jgi:hypothetical protein
LSESLQHANLRLHFGRIGERCGSAPASTGCTTASASATRTRRGQREPGPTVPSSSALGRHKNLASAASPRWCTAVSARHKLRVRLTRPAIRDQVRDGRDYVGVGALVAAAGAAPGLVAADGPRLRAGARRAVGLQLRHPVRLGARATGSSAASAFIRPDDPCVLESSFARAAPSAAWLRRMVTPVACFPLVVHAAGWVPLAFGCRAHLSLGTAGHHPCCLSGWSPRPGWSTSRTGCARWEWAT